MPWKRVPERDSEESCHVPRASPLVLSSPRPFWCRPSGLTWMKRTRACSSLGSRALTLSSMPVVRHCVQHIQKPVSWLQAQNCPMSFYSLGCLAKRWHSLVRIGFGIGMSGSQCPLHRVRSYVYCTFISFLWHQMCWSTALIFFTFSCKYTKYVMIWDIKQIIMWFLWSYSWQWAIKIYKNVCYFGPPFFLVYCSLSLLTSAQLS